VTFFYQWSAVWQADPCADHMRFSDGVPSPHNQQQRTDPILVTMGISTVGGSGQQEHHFADETVFCYTVCHLSCRQASCWHAKTNPV